MGKRSVPGPADCHWDLTPACKQTGLGGIKNPWHPEVTTAAWQAVSRKSPLAGFYLLKEIWAGEKPRKPPPFSTLCPIPAPASSPPPGVSGGQNSSHKIGLERSHELLNLNTKGEDKPKINRHAPRRTHACTHTALGRWSGGKRRWEGGWVVRKNFMLASF